MEYVTDIRTKHLQDTLKSELDPNCRQAIELALQAGTIQTEVAKLACVQANFGNVDIEGLFRTVEALHENCMRNARKTCPALSFL